MELLDKSSQRLIIANIRLLIVPVVSLVVVIILLVSVANYSVPRLKSDVNEINSNNQKIVVLEEKLEILRQIQESVLSSADSTLLALPSKNPTLWVLDQVNRIAADKSLTVAKKKVDLGISDKDNIIAFTLDLSVQGDGNSIVEFLDEVVGLAPIMIPTKISYKLSEVNAGEVIVDVSLGFYKSDLPETIPAITQPIKNLTNEEISLLEKVYPLKAPEFTGLDPAINEERKDPFN